MAFSSSHNLFLEPTQVSVTLPKALYRKGPYMIRVCSGPAPKYCILDTFVGYYGHSISSKGFLPTEVDKMVIWVKFTHSSPFQFADS